MAVSSVSIVNQALSRIGVSAIISLTEDSKPARECNLIYTDLLNEALTLRAWNFCTGRADLGQLITPPLSVYQYKYQLPVDNLQVLEVINTESNGYGYGIEYRVEGNELLTDEVTCQILYIQKVTDMSRLSELFRSYFTVKLAYSLAYTLSGAVALQDRLEKEMKEKLLTAKVADGMEINPRLKVNSIVVDTRYRRGRY